MRRERATVTTESEGVRPEVWRLLRAWEDMEDEASTFTRLTER